MQNFKDVCGNYDEAWFEMEPAENKKFLEWAKTKKQKIYSKY